MSEHHAHIRWRRGEAEYAFETYPRDHEWTFAGAAIPASASPDYRGDEKRLNPEDALVAALSSCHMLGFLAIAAKKRLSLDSYSDDATGVLEKNAEGRLAVTRTVLRPKIVWSAGVNVSREELDHLHHMAHEGCFIANSVKTSVKVEPQV